MLHAKGPLLSVDVGAREATAVDVDDVLEGFIGGRGVATALAFDRVPADADPPVWTASRCSRCSWYC